MRCCDEAMASRENIQPRRFEATGLMLSKSAMGCGEAPSKLNSAVKARDGDSGTWKYQEIIHEYYYNMSTQASHLSTPLPWRLRPSRSMSIMYASGRWHHIQAWSLTMLLHRRLWMVKMRGDECVQSWNREEFSCVSLREFVQLVAVSEQPNAISTISVGRRIEKLSKRKRKIITLQRGHWLPGLSFFWFKAS